MADQTYRPPEVTTETTFEVAPANVAPSAKVVLFIGEGAENKSVSNLEIVRGSSTVVDTSISKEDLTGRAVVSISTAGAVTLGAFDGARKKVQVTNYPIVKGDGTGTVTTDRGSVTVTVNDLQIVVLSVNGTTGVVELAQAPKATDDVRISYYFKRSDTQFTDTVSAQVTSTSAYVRAVSGIYDVNSGASTGATLDIHAASTGVEANNVLNLVVDGVSISFTLASNTAYTISQLASALSSLGAVAGTSLTASAFLNNLGQSAIQLNADQDVAILDGSANATLFLVAGTSDARRKTFYTSMGPIVDGTNGGVTTTNVADVTVKVNNVTVTPVSVDGATRAVTLASAPPPGAKVTITYYANTWQDTFDYVGQANVLAIQALGAVPGGSEYVEGADFVLHGDKVYWGAAATATAGTSAVDSTPLDETQITTSLVDNKTFLSLCVVTSSTTVELPFPPTVGNGRDTPLGTSLFQSVANDRIGVAANRPDLVNVYYGTSEQEALRRGPVDLVSVEGTTVTLVSPVPAGSHVYVTCYYNQLTDATYTVTCSRTGASGIGQYTLTNEAGDTLYNASYSTASKGAGLTGVDIVFPSGSEIRPDLRFEAVDSTSFLGPVAETVTVKFAARNASPAEFAVPGEAPYAFIANESDTVSVEINGNATTVDLSNPMGATSWDGGFFASLVSDRIDYTGGAGSTVGASYTLTANEEINLIIDEVDIPVTVAAGAAKTIANVSAAINLEACGVVATAEANATVTNIIFPATVPNSDVANYFAGWKVTVANGATLAAVGTYTITSYNASTRVATVPTTTAAVTSPNVIRIFNPDTVPQYVAATKFDGPTTISVGELDQFLVVYSGSTTGVAGLGVCTIPNATYATATTLAAAVDARLAASIAAAIAAPDATLKGLSITCEADADGHLVFKLAQLPGDDAAGVISFINTGIADAANFCILAGIDYSTGAGLGQASLINAPVARTYTVTQASAPTKSYDRLVLRNRLLVGGGGALPAESALSHCNLIASSGDGLTKAGLVAGQYGEAGIKAVVSAATLTGLTGFTGGQATGGHPLVTFYDGLGANPINSVLEFNLDGEDVLVNFTDSASGTATPLGPITTTTGSPASATVLDFIVNAIYATGSFGSIDAIVAAGLVAQEGANIRLRSYTYDVSSSLIIGSGSANAVLGFTDGQSAARELVSVRKLVSALNSHRTATLSDKLFTDASDSSGSNFFAEAGAALATVVEDMLGNEYLLIVSVPATTGAYGASSTIVVNDALVSSVVTDSWLTPGTGINALDGESDTGESALEGFYVTSTNPDGSGSVSTSVLNNGTGQDGVVGQTYRDEVTGLTFTVLPRGWFDNSVGPWTSYPTTATSTFKVVVSDTFTTNANVPHNMVGGVDLKVANMTGVAVGDTATVKTFDRSGSEPAVGDSYYLSFTYQKSDLSTKVYTDLSEIVREYGAVSTENPVSLAAHFATINGASTIAISQVLRESGGSQASITSYQTAIDALKTPLANGLTPTIIIPLRTDSIELYQYLARTNDERSSMKYKMECTSIVGLPSGTESQAAVDAAVALKNPRMRLVYPDLAKVKLSDVFGRVREYIVDGAMIAAALAGFVLRDSNDPATPWDGVQLSGFSGLGRRLSEVEKNYVAKSGVTVVEDRPNVLRVRHGLTTDRTNLLTEIPTVRQIADEVQQQIRLVLEPYIGKKNLPGMIPQIEGAVGRVFWNLMRLQVVQGVGRIRVSTVAGRPNTLAVEAYYSPVLPLQYIPVSLTVSASGIS